MSACPACRAVSSIMCTMIQRSVRVSPWRGSAEDCSTSAQAAMISFDRSVAAR